MLKRFFAAPKFFVLNFCVVCLIFVYPAQAQNVASGKNPIIVIPGLVGSELVNQKTGEVVWFKLARSKTDDLRLPLSENLRSMRDDLMPRDVLRSVKIGLLPRQPLYGSLIDFLKTQGYEERSWDNPKASDALYVFAYDWRRDNVESAKLLIEKIETLKRRLGRPDLKFDVVAHSMGGLVARYAAMYGAADLPDHADQPQPTWAGAKHFDRLILLGTPNAGSMLALQSLASEFSLFQLKTKINLPFVQKFTKFDVFASLSVFELLPGESARFFDENLRPLKIDVFDPKNWDKFGWGAINDKNFAKQFSPAEQTAARGYLAAVLRRAKLFHAALNAVAKDNSTPISIRLVGAECKSTLDSAIVYKDRQTKTWKSLFKSEKYERSDGKIVSAEQVQKTLFAPGDGIVSKRSLVNDSSSELNRAAPIFECENHNNLVANLIIQKRIAQLLTK